MTGAGLFLFVQRRIHSRRQLFANAQIARVGNFGEDDLHLLRIERPDGFPPLRSASRWSHHTSARLCRPPHRIASAARLIGRLGIAGHFVEAGVPADRGNLVGAHPASASRWELTCPQRIARQLNVPPAVRMNSRAKYYRRRGVAAQERAAQTIDHSLKETFKDVARNWLALAERGLARQAA